MRSHSRRSALLAVLLLGMALGFRQGSVRGEAKNALVIGSSVRLTATEFTKVMELLARSWSQQDTEAALSCFTADAVYIEPPDIQFFEGHTELRAYFGALKPGTFMKFHNLWFDETRQVGAGEYSFGLPDRPTANHGVVVLELRDGQIAIWREYQRKGPREFRDFLAREGKTWKWTIQNYP